MHCPVCAALNHIEFFFHLILFVKAYYRYAQNIIDTQPNHYETI